MKELIKQAKQGDAEAQYLLGLPYIECYFCIFLYMPTSELIINKLHHVGNMYAKNCLHE